MPNMDKDHVYQIVDIDLQTTVALSEDTLIGNCPATSLLHFTLSSSCNFPNRRHTNLLSQDN